MISGSIWENFFVDGGLGMYPIAFDGFLLLAAALLLALRPERRFVTLVVSLGLLTLGAGVLATTVGFVTVCNYVARIPPDRVVEIAFMGVGEALHCLVFALLIIEAALFLMAIAAWRAARARAAS